MDESINIEVNNNHLDYKILRKYKRYLYNQILKAIIYLAIFFFVCLELLYIYYGIASISNLIDILVLILIYEVSSSIYVKLALRMQKDLLFNKEDDEELHYDLMFKEDSIIIKAGKISGKVPYERINKIVSIEKGYFIFYSRNVYLFCETDQLDEQTKKEVVKILKGLSVKWIEG